MSPRDQKSDPTDPKSHPGGTQKCLRRVPGDPFSLLQDHLETLPDPGSRPYSKKWIIVEGSHQKSLKGYHIGDSGRSSRLDPPEG